MKSILVMLIFCLGNCLAVAQVNLQTGAAQVNIPLYSYSDPNNRLGTSISLDYTSGNGLKVSEISSSVGTGWFLSAGGFIERIQNGIPDDQKNNDTYTYPWFPEEDPNGAFWVWAKNYYPNGYLYSGSYLPTDVIPNRGVYTPAYPGPYHNFKLPQFYTVDREQDMFRFNFNGRDGYFVISQPNSSGICEIKTLYDSKLIIEKIDGDLNNNQNIRTTISAFKITDEDGTQYLFSDADLDEVCEYDQIKEYDNNGYFSNNVTYLNTPTSYGTYRVITGTPKNKFIKNRWHLSEIKNPMSNARIEFQYENFNMDKSGNKNMQVTYGGGSNALNITIERLRGTCKRLKTIILSPKEKVELEYSYMNRIDLNSDKSLENIVVKYDNEIKYKWNFEFGYFVKNEIKTPTYNYSAEDLVWARLYLLKLKKIGVQGLSEPPYSFEYYKGNEDGMNDAVPAPFSNKHNLAGFNSGFGYYNSGSNTVSSNNPPFEPFGPRLLPKSAYELILVNVGTDPTTGNGDNLLPRNGIIKAVENPMGAKLTFEYEPHNVGTEAHHQYYGVRVNKTISFDGMNHAQDKTMEYKYTLENGSSSGWGFDILRNNKITPVQLYNCADGSYPLIDMLSIAKSGVQYMYNPTIHGANAGSVQIAKGVVVPQFAVIYFMNIVIAILDGWFGNHDMTSQTINNTVYTSEPYNPNTLPFQYSRVEVTEKLNSIRTGKSAYEFTSPTTSSAFNIDYPSQSNPYSSKQRYAYWIYGLPTKVSSYDKDLNLVKKIENTYNPLKSISTDVRHKSQKWIPATYVYNCGFNPSSSELSAYEKVSSEMYAPIFGRIELTQTKEYTYDHTGSYALKLTNYTYSGQNYLPNQITTFNSKGEQIRTAINYAYDYTPGNSFVQSMRNKNMVNQPIGSFTYITKPGNIEYLLSGSVTEYGTIANGDIKPLHEFTYRSNYPQASSAVLITNSSWNPNTNSNFFKITQSIYYNNDGQVVRKLSDRGSIATLYDYDKKHPVAIVANASDYEIAYTSFEGESKGNWVFNEQDIITEFAPTGKKCFKLNSSGSGLWSTRMSDKSFLSFWTKGGVPTVYSTLSGMVNNYQTFSPSKIYINNYSGWTYYEYIITNADEVYIENMGGSNSVILIDEVRLCPVKSRMSTTTYDPLLGKTSECDANGRITYYQYDGLGRLKTIKDQNFDVVKAYEYNLKTIFYNFARSKTFIKSCPAGYSGEPYSYYVPANKYSSLISQKDAEDKVEADFNANGQNAANTYSSCTLTTPIHAQLSYENVYGPSDDTRGDIVVRFYDDNNNLFTVQNHAFTYYVYDNCSNTMTTQNVTVNGAEVTLVSNATLTYGSYEYDPYYGFIWVTCNVDYWF